jgi:enamine deaminase RidA (YjgF/YER057c/UK114 family)
MSQFKVITNLNVLNEAYSYEKPSCFSRGLSYAAGDSKFIYISGTASIDKDGKSLFIDNFKAQTIRAFMNIKMLLAAENASWKDVIKTTIYIKNMEEDYDAFNLIRKDFFNSECIGTFPASTCVQATLCRPELLIEMDAIAIVKRPVVRF